MKKILVTGGSGLVGTCLKRIMPDAVYLSSADGDLTKHGVAEQLIGDIRPDAVIHLAAKVGGITANINEPTAFLHDNLLMNTYVLQSCLKFDTKRVIALLSSCMYPDVVENYPMTEDDIHIGPPPPTNFGYGYAKRMMAVQIETIRKEYDLNWNYLIPSNMYGENDHYDEGSHFVPALIAKIIRAQKSGQKHIDLLGDGKPLRQFVYAGDVAEVIKFWVQNDINADVNIATKENISIKDIAEIALKACDAEDLAIRFDPTTPSGQYRKDVSYERLLKHFPDYQLTPLTEGIRRTYDHVFDKIN